MFFYPSLPTGKHREKSDKFKPGLDPKRSKANLVSSVSYGCFNGAARAGYGAERSHIRQGEYGANQWRRLISNGLGGLH